jgi:hypothetical protein
MMEISGTLFATQAGIAAFMLKGADFPASMA